jgi:hypothetical protein
MSKLHPSNHLFTLIKLGSVASSPIIPQFEADKIFKLFPSTLLSIGLPQHTHSKRTSGNSRIGIWAEQHKYFDKKGNGNKAPQSSQYVNIIVSSKLKMKISVNFWLGLQNKIVIISCRRIARLSSFWNRKIRNLSQRRQTLETIDKLQSNGLKFTFFGRMGISFNFTSCILCPNVGEKSLHYPSWVYQIPCD